LKLRLSFQGLVLSGYLAVVLVTLVFTSYLLQDTLKPRLTAQFESSLGQQLLVLREVLRDRWQEGLSLAQTDRLADDLGAVLSLRLTLVEPGGKVLGDSEVDLKDLDRLENHAGRPEIKAALDLGRGSSLRRSSTLGLDLLYVTTLLGDPEEPRLVIRLALPLAEMAETLSGIRRLIIGVTLIGILLSLGAAFLVSQRITHPIRSLKKTTRRITAGDHSRRVRRYPSHEIGDLARAFDRMADHLEEEIDRATRGRDRLEAILRAMQEGVLVLDGEGRIILANQAVAELLELTTDPQGRRTSEIIRNAELIKAVSRVLAGEPHASVEVRTLGLRGRVVEVHVAALNGRQEATGGAVAVFHDVTDRKRTEEMRRDLVANVSHELRTPLTAIRGSVETILSSGLEDPRPVRQFLEMIDRQAGRLQGLAEDLLTLASLEGQGTRSKPEAIQLAELADAVLSSVIGQAEAKGIEVERELDQPEAVFTAHRRQIEEAVVNLLDNAVKYTEAGGTIVFRAEVVQGQVFLTVSDTGIGIPKSEQDRVFERFYRVDRNRSREMGGTGLGLAIVKHVAQAHGGRVELESTLGRGSTFRIVIPLLQPDRRTEAPAG